jgi:formylglycine-generating enzyme required for sulfatase activity
MKTLAVVTALVFGVGAAGCQSAPETTESQGPVKFDYDSLGLKWLPIPAGSFLMGCSPSDEVCHKDESPQHKVTLSAFEMMETEVTETQFVAVMGFNPSDHAWAPGDAPYPVDDATWFNSNVFCKAVGGRLPTEAEWEYAARAGTTTRHYCGDDSACLKDIACYSHNSGNRKCPIKSFKPNAFGLYDMLGNVWEWTNDWFEDSYYARSPELNPQGLDNGDRKSVRGGGYNGFGGLRVSLRSNQEADGHGGNKGFRCVR